MTATLQPQVTLTVLTGGMTKTMPHRPGLTVQDMLREAEIAANEGNSFQIDGRAVNPDQPVQAGQEVLMLGKIQGA